MAKYWGIEGRRNIEEPNQNWQHIHNQKHDEFLIKISLAK